MDLSSLSSQLNISIQELRLKARAKGFFVAPKANKIDNQLAKQIFDSLIEKKAEVSPQAAKPKHVKLPAYIKVRDFANVLDLPVTSVIKKLIENGVMATINEEVDFETASIVAQDLGFETSAESEKKQIEFGSGFLEQVLKEESQENLKPRPPIVAIMGHVDHGKTTLLDTLRKSKVAEGESGGITQHIGAYQIEVRSKSEPKSRPNDSDGGIPQQSLRDDVTTKHKIRKITFLDTPGHEAFSEMRARGANVTDIIVLVVAADDGVRPQTIEVINRAKFTNTPLIVAINKTDKPEANVMRVKQELAGVGVLTEEWGGKTIACEISAKKNTGLDHLLEMILLTAELENFQANPQGKTVGTVIESKVSPGKGTTATVVIRNGTLRMGDIVAAGVAYGRIRSLEDETRKKLKEALPSSPAQISGLSEPPHAGDILQIFQTLDEAKSLALRQKSKHRSSRLATRLRLAGDAETKSLNLVLKTDVSGSLEAIKQSIDKLKNEEVKINIIGEGVGEINESDVLLAAPSKATVVGFHVKVNPKAENLAKQQKVIIDTYEVIYELLEDITSAVVKMFTPETEKITNGKAKVLAIFRTEKNLMIVGGRVEEGDLKKLGHLAIWRADTEIGKGEIVELQQNKSGAKSVPIGNEFGIKIKTPIKILEGDVLENYEEKIKQKTL